MPVLLKKSLSLTLGIQKVCEGWLSMNSVTKRGYVSQNRLQPIRWEFLVRLKVYLAVPFSFLIFWISVKDLGFQRWIAELDNNFLDHGIV